MRLLVLMAAFAALSPSLCGAQKENTYRVDPNSPEAMAVSNNASSADGTDWFTRDRFGMFVHWTPAAAPTATWKELDILDPDGAVGDPSWYFNRYKIPVGKWKRLAGRFNPQRFDPEVWVKLARDAGMRYIVLTSKHHDGFAMFDSAVSDYDLMDATPFKRDVVKEVASACRKYGIRLCLYYSHAQDWEHPDGANNTWDFKREDKNFGRYFEEKCKPQVRELLRQYGPLGLLWFDTPATINAEQSAELYDMVKSIQPDCLVNSRIGHGFGDYMSMGDSQFPDCVITSRWETASTSSSDWLYKPGDKPRMTCADIVRYLVGNVSRGGNLLLNFGPDHDGAIPDDSAALLKDVGRWMALNSESIYENTFNPFLAPFEWGTVTQRPGFIYLHVTAWPGKTLTLNGLTNVVSRVSLLASDTSLAFRQTRSEELDLNTLTIDLPPTAPDPVDTVIKVKIDGSARTQPCTVPQHGDLVRLDAMLAGGNVGRQGFSGSAMTAPYARINPAPSAPHVRLTEWGGGYLENWLNPQESLSWDVKISRPGNYEVYVISSKCLVRERQKKSWLWDGGHRAALSIGDSRLEGVIRDDRLTDLPFRTNESLDKVSHLGVLSINKPGTYSATFNLIKPGGKNNVGLTLRSIVLVPKS